MDVILIIQAGRLSMPTVTSLYYGAAVFEFLVMESAYLSLKLI